MSPAQLTALRAAVEALDLAPRDVWLAYFALTGSEPLAAVESWLRGDATPTSAEYRILSVAVDEALIERGLDPMHG
jgi:hypothetical protein